MMNTIIFVVTLLLALGTFYIHDHLSNQSSLEKYPEWMQRFADEMFTRKVRIAILLIGLILVLATSG